MDSNTLAIVGALALLVRIGHTLHTMGAVRARSVAAVAARVLIGTASIVLLVYATGHLLKWIFDEGTGQPIGPAVFFMSAGPFLSVLAIALLPAALLGGATAERARVRGLLPIAALVTAVVLPLVTVGGWLLLSRLDHRGEDGSYLSRASLSAVTLIWPVVAAHLLAGAGGLTLARVIGARAGKYNRDGSANAIPGHSLPIMITGDLLLIIGLPMLAASIAGAPGDRVIHALLAGSAATLGAVLTSSLREGRVDVLAPWNAALTGLVAGSLIGPGFGIVAIAVGAICGLVMPILSLKTDLRLRIDETSGLSLPHLVGGLAGLVGATVNAVFEGDASLVSGTLLASIALGGGIAVVLIGILATWIPAMVMRQIGWLRVDSASEVEGLDLSEHDINAYPDFQQTLIKSYHLRQ